MLVQKSPFDDIDWAGLLGKVLAVLAVLVVTWILALLVKKAIAKATEKIGFLQKAGGDGQNIGSSLGSIASLLIWMFGLVAVLNILGLTSALKPLENMLNDTVGFLPKLIGAAVIFIVGSLLAKVVRDLITTGLGTLPIEKWLNKAGGASAAAESQVRGGQRQSAAPAQHQQAGHQAQQAGPGPQGQQASVGGQYAAAGAPQDSRVDKIIKAVATVAYALIMIVVAISALQTLGIQSISRPANQMLSTIFEVIPAVIAAAILLAIGGMIAKFVADILSDVLAGVGIDDSLRKMDVLSEGKSAVPGIVKVVQVVILLFFAVMATKALGFPEITKFITEVLTLGGRVLFGGAIIAAGFFIANLLAKLVSSQGAAGSIVKYATIVLFAAMGLKYMGIADSIIELGFGALVVGGAAAAALAFGLGGRDAAARQLDQLGQKRARNDGPGPDVR